MTNETQHEPTVQTSDICSSSQYYTDEIDLLDIWRMLVSQRKLIISVALFLTTVAIVYVLVAAPVYKAEAFLLPPLGKDVEGLNHPDIRQTTVDTVYDEMIKNLQSLALRRRFFDEHNLAEYLIQGKTSSDSEEEIFTENFHELLLVHKGKKDKSVFVTVSLEGEEPAQITAWLNDFVSIVDSYTVSKLAEAVEIEIKNKKRAITEKIDGLRQTAANRRLDRIMILQEQIYIAEKLGIVKRKDASGDLTTKIQNTSATGFSINSEGTPLYLRGTEELRAEIDVLQKRKFDDPFIKNLRDLQEDLVRLEKVRLVKDDISTVRIDRLAVQPEDPIKPKRKLIVALGLGLGLIIGLFSAFLADFVKKARIRLQ